MNCPHSKEKKCNRKLEPVLAGVSWKCVNPTCQSKPYIEFYKCTGGKIMTAKEFRQAQEDEK